MLFESREGDDAGDERAGVTMGCGTRVDPGWLGLEEGDGMVAKYL